MCDCVGELSLNSLKVGPHGFENLGDPLLSVYYISGTVLGILYELTFVMG